MAFSPGFFEIAIVTAGAVPASSMPFCAAAGPAPKLTYCSGWSGPSLTVATSCRYTGRPSCSATTSPATSSRFARNCARLHRDVRAAGDQRARLLDEVGRLQRAGELGQRQAVASEPLRIQRHVHGLVRTPDRIDVARARHALQFRLYRVRDLPQFVRPARRILRPQRQARGSARRRCPSASPAAASRRARAGASPGLSRWRCRGARSHAVRSCPTSNCTVTTATPGRETE